MIQGILPPADWGKWYRVSDNVLWHMRLMARWQPGFPDGTWVDVDSDYAPHPAP